MLARLSIRTRIALLSGTLLLVLAATTLYLSRKLIDNTAGTVETANLLATIEQANNTQLAFGEMRYWMADLAVSQLTLSETNAKAARARTERYLDQLALSKPQRIAAVRGELALYVDLAGRAVDEYTDDRRVIGNTLLAQARQHSIEVDRLLASIVAELTAEAIAARDRIVAEAATAMKVSHVVTAAAVLAGSLFAFFVLRSIARPLRRLVVAMDRLNAGNTEVEIPAAGADEIGSMARTLHTFRDTMQELRQVVAQFEALRAVGRAVGSTLDLDSVLGVIVTRAVEFSNASIGVIYEYDDERQEFLFRSSEGTTPELAAELKATPLRVPRGAVGAVEVPDLADMPGSMPRVWSVFARAGYRGLLGVPLMHDERVIGGLIVLRREPGHFNPSISRLIDAFATQSALAARNAKLFDEQRRREQELREAHDELKAAQANLIHSEKMASLGQLTAGIAHEIKNPLNFVNNFAELSVELLDEFKRAATPALAALDADRRAEIDETIDMLSGNLSRIAEHGSRADGIVKSMLEHSRGVSGERREVDLNALIEEALNLAYHGARAQNDRFIINLEREFDQALKPIALVPQDITRVFLNLFGNGFYAANKRGADRPLLRVATRDLGSEVEVKVRDNGTGVAPEVRDKLFQPFFTTKPTGEGTGLGLSISYDIVTQQHGGTITVESEPGVFTEFTVRLPRQ